MWSDKYESTVQELKHRLTSAPIPTIPNGTGSFVVYTNASRREFGCVIMQHGKVTSTVHDNRRTMRKLTHNLEVVVVTFPLNI